jgi:hypothetical protein
MLAVGAAAADAAGGDVGGSELQVLHGIACLEGAVEVGGGVGQIIVASGALPG